MTHQSWQDLLDAPGHPEDEHKNYLSIVADIKALFPLSDFSKDEKAKVRNFLTESIKLENQRIKHYQRWSGGTEHYARLVAVLGYQVHHMENILEKLA